MATFCCGQPDCTANHPRRAVVVEHMKQAHLRSASDYPFRCSACVRCFSRKSDATQHLRRGPHVRDTAYLRTNPNSILLAVTTVADSPTWQRNRLEDPEVFAVDQAELQDGPGELTDTAEENPSGTPAAETAGEVEEEEVSGSRGENPGPSTPPTPAVEEGRERERTAQRSFPEMLTPGHSSLAEVVLEPLGDFGSRDLSLLSSIPATPDGVQRGSPPPPIRIYEDITPVATPQRVSETPQRTDPPPPALTPVLPVLTGQEVEQNILSQLLYGSPGRMLKDEIQRQVMTAQHQDVMQQLMRLTELVHVQGQALIGLMAALRAQQASAPPPGGQEPAHQPGLSVHQPRRQSRWERSEGQLQAEGAGFCTRPSDGASTPFSRKRKRVDEHEQLTEKRAVGEREAQPQVKCEATGSKAPPAGDRKVFRPIRAISPPRAELPRRRRSREPVPGREQATARYNRFNGPRTPPGSPVRRAESERE